MAYKRSHPLKTFRDANDLTQGQAAKLFGVSQAAWSRYERNLQRPNKKLAKRLIRETGVSSDILMGVTL